MRRLFSSLALSSAVSLLALWGGGVVTSSAITSISPSKAQASAFARAINLVKGDLPGFKSSSGKHNETAAEKKLEHELKGCIGPTSNRKPVADVPSKQFEHETKSSSESVSSEVSVSATVPPSAAELEKIRSGHTRRCLAHYLDLLLESEEHVSAETISPVRVTTHAPEAPGATGSFGWHITAAITVHRLTFKVYVDILSFVYGKADVSLLTSSTPRRFPQATEQHLFSLLLTRAESQPVP